MSSSAIDSVHGSYLMPSLEHARVADAMHPGVLTCPADATLTEAARLMASHHVHCVAVPDGHGDADDGTPPWTMVSDRDVVRAGLADGAEPTVAELDPGACVTAHPDTPLREAAATMLGFHVSHLLVVEPDSGRPVGILSTLDIAGILGWGEG